MRKRRISNLIISVCLIMGFLMFILSGIGIYKQFSSKLYYSRLKDKVINNKDGSCDVSTLESLYPSAVAWIDIPNTSVSYPVVIATKGNEYYLSHDPEGNVSQYGSIFIDAREKNNPFEQKNCIIYGHNMGRWSDMMFSPLKKYEDESYYGKHKYVNMYREGCCYQYLIVSVHRANEQSSVYEINPDNFNEWLEGNINLSKYPCDEVEGEVNSIVTLSTCSNEGDDRIVIMMALFDIIN